MVIFKLFDDQNLKMPLRIIYNLILLINLHL